MVYLNSFHSVHSNFRDVRYNVKLHYHKATQHHIKQTKPTSLTINDLGISENITKIIKDDLNKI